MANKRNGEPIIYTRIWEDLSRLMTIRDSKNEKRLIDNSDFYCHLFNSYPFGKDDLRTRFDISISVDPRVRQMQFTIKRKLDIWKFSIPINLISVDTFEEVLLGKSSLSELLFEVLNTSKGEQFDRILTADQVMKSFSSWKDYAQQLGFNDGKHLLNFNDTTIREKLLSQNFVWYHGCSCSGKSYMGIRELNSTNSARIAYNPCFSTEYEYEIVKLMLYYGENISLLIDDIQCDTEKAKELFSIISDSRNSFKLRNVFVFLISWTDLLKEESFFSKFEGWFDPVEADTSRYISQLKARIGDKRLCDVCGNNLALLNTAGTVISSRRYQNPEKALFDAFVKTNDPEKLFSIYKLCVLGTYAYLVEPRSLRKDISRTDLSTIKKVNGKYYAGHKEICRFLSAYIEKNAEELRVEQLPKPDRLVYEYIQSTEPSKQWKTIKQLIDKQGEESLQNVSPIWKGLHRFEQEIALQTRKDPTWKDAPSSMYFVLKAASLLGVISDYEKVINNFCNKFRVTREGIEIKYDEILTTNDFELIKGKMIEEDRDAKSPFSYERGDLIDCGRAHKNWLLGLVVGLKNELIQFGRNDLYLAAIRELLSLQDPSGFWYPRRVPWITARVLIGLSQAGFMSSNYKVNKGVEFLLQSLGENDHWDAHTGGWNTAFETSSLCLEAIYNLKGRNNEDINNITDKVVNFLLANKSEWMKGDMIVDGTATACCLLKNSGYNQDLIEYIQTLCEKHIYNIVQKNPELDLAEKQSCETTQIAWYVMDFCWDVLYTNLPDMLNQFVTRSLQTSKERAKTMEKKFKIFFSYSEDSDNTVRRIKKVSSFLREKGYDVRCYADESPGTNVVMFMQDAPTADLVLVFGSKTYRDKALAINKKGSGVLFENLILSQLFIQNHMEKIVPIAFEKGTSFEESFPPPYNTNKGLKCYAVRDSFLKTLERTIEEKQGGVQHV